VTEKGEDMIGENVTPKLRLAIASLVATGNVREAAKAAGVAPKTLYFWLSQTAFKRELRASEELALESFSRALVSLAELTTKALRDGLQDESMTVRLRAAGMVLDGVLRVRELLTLEQRVSKLEGAHEIA
jgi:transposase-like protein